MVNKGQDVDEKIKEKIKEFADECYEHGLGCGQKIAEAAAFLHPDALLIVPLYRSCIVVEQNDQDKKDGSCKIHGYGDPHWLGKDINIDALKSEDFRFYFKAQGYREGPDIVKMKILPLMSGRSDQNIGEIG